MNRQDSGFACNAKEGLLDRYKNFLMGWGTRFMKLDRSYLHNFEAKDSPNPSGSLVRGEITRCTMNDSFKGAAGPHVFDVVCRNGTTWYLRANSFDEMADWMIAISPNCRADLDRLREGTRAPLVNTPCAMSVPLHPGQALPPPIAPHSIGANQQPPGSFGVFEGEPPQKNPNARQPEEGEASNDYMSLPGPGSNMSHPVPANNNSNPVPRPPSYSDLFDKHDPVVQGRK